MSTDYSSHSEGHQTGLMWYSVYIKKLFNPISFWINPVWYVCWSKSVIFHDDGRQWKLPWNYDSSFTKLAELKAGETNTGYPPNTQTQGLAVMFRWGMPNMILARLQFEIMFMMPCVYGLLTVNGNCFDVFPLEWGRSGLNSQ